VSNIEPYRPRQAARVHQRALQSTARQEQLSVERMAAKGRLTRQALGEALLTALTVEEAASIAPSGIPEYRMIAAFGAQALVDELRRF
jgi:hypothetical protein